MRVQYFFLVGWLVLFQVAVAQPMPRSPRTVQLPSCQITRHGTGPQQMILIPGMGCTGEVWDDAVARYAATHTVHVVSLAGFGAVPATQTDSILPAVKRDVLQYLRAERLHQPLLVGHSMGGLLALWVAVEAPAETGPVVVVDGLPYIGAQLQPSLTPQDLLPQAQAMRERLRQPTDSLTQVRRMRANLPNLILDSARREQVLRWRTDDRVVAQAYYEVLTTDLRGRLGALRQPVLLMAALHSYTLRGLDRATVEANLKRQMQQAPQTTYVLFEHTRHFIFWDDAKGFYAALDDFLRVTGRG